MATIHRFEDLEAWKSARELAKLIYDLTKTGPLAKDFELRRQMREAAISPVSNIAEGFERGGRNEFISFLSIAKGSVGELEAQLYVALDQQYLSAEQFRAAQAKAHATIRLIAGLMHYLRGCAARGVKFMRAAEGRADNQKPRTTNHVLSPGAYNRA